MMIKLTDILDEARIVPASTSKSKALYDLYDFDPYLLSYASYYGKLEELVKDDGYDTLSDFLKGNFGYKEEELKKVTEVLTNYYRAIQPGDVKRVDNKTKVTGYVNVEEFNLPDEDHNLIILTKF